ncbi:MAG: sugar phosphate isomerase/epimerase family protein [Verrucomicrobiota bacterium]
MEAPPLFGISEYTTWPLTFEEDLELYTKCGVGAIELCESKLDPGGKGEDQLRALQDTGLVLSSVQPRMHSLFPDAPRPEPTDPRERREHYEKTIRRIGPYFPGTTLVAITGAAPDADYDQAYRTAIREYAELANIAANEGVRIGLEPLNPILMNADTFICTLQHAWHIIQAVDDPAFGLFVDVWHIWEDAAAPALIGEYGDKIFGVHLNDWKTPRTFGDRHLPGEGDIPLVPLIRAIDGSGYDGAYTLEIFSEHHLEDSLWKEPEITVRQGRRAFEKLWAEVCA